MPEHDDQAKATASEPPPSEARLRGRTRKVLLRRLRRAERRLVPWATAAIALLAALLAWAAASGLRWPSPPEGSGWVARTASLVLSIAALAVALLAAVCARRAVRHQRRQAELISALLAALPPATVAACRPPASPGPQCALLRRACRAVRARIRTPAVARALAWTAVAVILTLSLSGWLRCVSVVNAPLEDAYIAFRYARNMAQGYVFVWNRGEAPSGGVTCPLFVAMLTPAFLTGVSPGNLAHALNAAGTLGLVLCVLAVVRVRRRAPPLLAALVLGIFLTDGAVVRHAGLGMETMVNAFALALHLALVVALLRRPRVGPAVASAFVAVAAGLLRPESTALCGLAYVPLVVKLARSRQWRLLALSAGLYVVLGLAYVTWSFSHFGYLLPNAFYLKCIDPRELVGWPFVRDFLVARWYVAGMAALGAVALAGRRRWAVLAACGLPALFLLGYLPTVLHEMSPHFRYEVPLYTYAVVMAALGLHAAQPRRLRTQTALGLPLVAAVILMAAAAVPAPPKLGMPMFMFATLGRALGSTGLGHRALLHTEAAGRMPYESDFRHIDSGAGLATDALCGRTPVTRLEQLAYVAENPADVKFALIPPAGPAAAEPSADGQFRSDYVQQSVLGRGTGESVLRRHLEDALSPAERSHLIWAQMVLLRDAYVCLGEYAIRWRGHRLFGYVGRDSPHRAELERVLRRCFVSTPLSRGELPAPCDGQPAGPEPLPGSGAGPPGQPIPPAAEQAPAEVAGSAPGEQL
jgi:hypothetical protein